MKTCVKCNIEKSLEEFHIDNKKADHRKDVCKVCKREYSKTHYEDKKEKRINQIEIWQLINKEEFIQKKKEWREKHREYAREYNKKYRKKNAKRIREYQKRYYQIKKLCSTS